MSKINTLLKVIDSDRWTKHDTRYYAAGGGADQWKLAELNDYIDRNGLCLMMEVVNCIPGAQYFSGFFSTIGNLYGLGGEEDGFQEQRSSFLSIVCGIAAFIPGINILVNAPAAAKDAVDLGIALMQKHQVEKRIAQNEVHG